MSDYAERRQQWLLDCAAKLPPEERERFLRDLTEARKLAFDAWARYRTLTGEERRGPGRPRKHPPRAPRRRRPRAPTDEQMIGAFLEWGRRHAAERVLYGRVLTENREEIFFPFQPSRDRTRRFVEIAAERGLLKADPDYAGAANQHKPYRFCAPPEKS